MGVQCDATVVFGQDQSEIEFPVHSLVLRLASPVFDAVISSIAENDKSPRIKVDGVTREQFSEFYEFLLPVTGRMKSILPENVNWMLALSDYYRVDSIKAECSELLMAMPSSTERLVQARQHGIEPLYERCLKDLTNDFVEADVEVVWVPRRLRGVVCESADDIHTAGKVGMEIQDDQESAGCNTLDMQNQYSKKPSLGWSKSLPMLPGLNSAVEKDCDAYFAIDGLEASSCVKDDISSLGWSESLSKLAVLNSVGDMDREDHVVRAKLEANCGKDDLSEKVDVSLLVPYLRDVLVVKGFFNDSFREDQMADLWDEYFPIGQTLSETDAAGAASLALAFLEACNRRRQDFESGGFC